MKKLNRFFWWCAGANIDVLEDCPTDHSKYFGVGGTIVFTALMASFAGGYAFITAFKEVAFKTIEQSTNLINGIQTIVPKQIFENGYTWSSIMMAIFFGAF